MQTAHTSDHYLVVKPHLMDYIAPRPGGDFYRHSRSIRKIAQMPHLYIIFITGTDPIETAYHNSSAEASG